GVLGADAVGFQTAGYARHFRQTCARVVVEGVEVGPGGVVVEGGGQEHAHTHTRFVDVGVFPMGIDVGALRAKKREPDVSYWVQLLRQRYAGLKLVVGRDKLDEVQGVRHKLEAFEQFLKKYPEFQGQVVLIQVALHTATPEAINPVLALVSRINSAFSTLTYQPVVFLHTHMEGQRAHGHGPGYLALLIVADTFLVASLREGMALRTHEYVVCQEGEGYARSAAGRPLVLSEFAGSYSYSGFRSCIAINPYDKRGTAEAIYQALTMSDAEAHSRWVDLHNHVVTQTAQTFVTSFLTRCVRAHTEHMSHVRAQAEHALPPPLDPARLLPRYKHSTKRLLLFDFEGALWQRDMSRAGLQRPPQHVLDLLRRFAADRRNEVWLLSGLPVRGVMERVAEACPGVGVVAENGCFIKPRGERARWLNMVANFNMTWKGPCVEILNYFTERTPGSFVEEREASVVWRFWTGPTDEAITRWARRQAAEAQNHIFDSLGERYGLRIIPGANSFLVLPSNISRSTAVGAILHPGGPAHSARATYLDGGSASDEAPFVFAVGGDEKLLRRLNELDNAETCSTGRRGTDARWRLDPGEAVRVLGGFLGR
ncbi:glycosyltransferase family 20-domain-containing protein, partial [Hygrophoropsis aurantiaca]